MSSGPSVGRFKRAFGDPELEALGAGADRRQRIVDLVHHARGERADRRELLGLRKARLGLSPLGDVFADRDDVRDLATLDVHRDLGDAIGARFAERLRLDRELLHLSRLEHVLELAAQQLGGLAMQDLENRPADRFLARHALQSRSRACDSTPECGTRGRSRTGRRQRIDDLLGEAALLVDLARARRDLRLEAMRVLGAAERGREQIGDGGRETPRPRRTACGRAARTRAPSV